MQVPSVVACTEVKASNIPEISWLLKYKGILRMKAKLPIKVE
jgi:hypothetical protein